MPEIKLNKSPEKLRCPRCDSISIGTAGKSRGKQRYSCKDCGRKFVLSPQKIFAKHILPENITPNEMKIYDIWDLRILGKKPKTSGSYALNFSKLNIPWLKSVIKEYLWSRIASDETATLQDRLTTFRKIVKYANEKYLRLKPEDIDREFVLGFITYLSCQGIKNKSANDITAHVKSFLEYCQRNKAIGVPQCQLIFQEDYLTEEKSQIKDIPIYTLKQIEDNLHELARPIAVMVKILKETGMRISEVCGLQFNCIRQDGDGDWWIEFLRFKMKKEDRLFISKDLATDILGQQKFIKDELGSHFLYLFCSTKGSGWFDEYSHKDENKITTRKEINHFIPVARRIQQITLRGYLYQLAHEYKITDISGEIYPVWRCHKFRHTHLTDCARKGMGIAHIMQRAGHLNPGMSMEYIHLTDKDQKKKMKELWDNTHFNIEGEIVASPNPELDTADLQWIKKGMNVQTSDNGYCTLLSTQNCIHQNLPCKECGSWATTLEFLEAHKKDLEETEKIIENARAKGWQRQVEKNVPRAERLKKIVNGMEKHENMKGLGHNEWEKA